MRRSILFLGLIHVACLTYGATAGLNTKVIRTLSDTTNYGGCMAQLQNAPSELGLNCPGSWVAFSCTGDFAPKDVAKINFETSQIAFLTGANIYVTVDDTKKHNGYCFVKRIDMY